MSFVRHCMSFVRHICLSQKKIVALQNYSNINNYDRKKKFKQMRLN